MIFDENLATVHAYLCADGYVTTNRPGKQKHYTIGLRNTNLTLLEDFQNKFYNYFKIRPHLYPGERCQLGSKEVYYILTNNFGSFYSKEWSMPLMKNNLINSWLRTYFDCEGWVFCKTHQNRHIGADSINEKGLDQVKRGLENIGIKVIKKENKKRKMFRLIIYGKDNLIRFRDSIGFLHPNKKEILERAILDYVSYVWKIDNLSDVRKIMIERVRVRSPYIVRIISKERKNLDLLAKKLLDLFDIKISNIHDRINGLGTKYSELSINRYLEVKKLVKHNLINDSEFAKINIK